MRNAIKALTANKTYTAAKAVAGAYLGFALYLSFSHIIGLFASWGSHTPWAAPLLLDSLMLIGRLIRSPQFATRTRTVGIILQLVGALFSLTANVLAGDNIGDRVLGAMVIVGFLVIEWVTDQVKPAEKDTTEEIAAKRTAAAAKAATTRKANAKAAQLAAAREAEKDADRRERARLARLAKAAEKDAARQAAEQELTVADVQAEFAKTVAPTSPAPITNRPEPGYL